MTEKRPTPPPFSLRLTFEERAQLEDAAGDLALGAYIRGELFKGGRPKRRRTRGKRPVKDYKELSRLFALLGKTRMASNLNQLAHAANSGSLIMTPESEEKLKQAADDLHFIRITLMRALGLLADDDEAAP
ncbi:MAG: plasmid mobilization relaxosome protein MobC [Altererythrobacter sp.]